MAANRGVVPGTHQRAGERARHHRPVRGMALAIAHDKREREREM